MRFHLDIGVFLRLSADSHETSVQCSVLKIQATARFYACLITQFLVS